MFRRCCALNISATSLCWNTTRLQYTLFSRQNPCTTTMTRMVPMMFMANIATLEKTVTTVTLGRTLQTVVTLQKTVLYLRRKIHPLMPPGDFISQAITAISEVRGYEGQSPKKAINLPKSMLPWFSVQTICHPKQWFPTRMKSKKSAFRYKKFVTAQRIAMTGQTRFARAKHVKWFLCIRCCFCCSFLFW